MECSNAAERILFADFFSAFNTQQPHVIAKKLITRFQLDGRLTLWIIDFFTIRSQRALVNNTFSNILRTRSCTLVCNWFSAGLCSFTLVHYTDDCRCTPPNCHLVKFADDTVLLSLLSGLSQHHGPALHHFVE